MIDLFNFERRKTSVTHVGALNIGGENPVRVQSMTTTSTDDTEGSVAQAKRIIDAGGELVRLTTQGKREAENLKNINAQLRADNYMAPLCADVHFNANVADVAALYAEKVRINPGNYVDPARTFKKLEYTDEEYAQELQKIEDRLIPFINICKENHTAVRIGVNHGSLSDRIRNRYGDTPEGIVESCMEFLRIFRKYDFHDIVISIKSSNTVVMVRSVRLLVAEMDKEGMHYPLHLGVTEAGEGEDGRIKSAVGIGALLADGIGDTIRVSLSEEPECEIPVAKHLTWYIRDTRNIFSSLLNSMLTLIISILTDVRQWLQATSVARMFLLLLPLERLTKQLPRYHHQSYQSLTISMYRVNYLRKGQRNRSISLIMMPIWTLPTVATSP